MILEKTLAKTFGTYEMLEIELEDLGSMLRTFSG